jgi:hypothetical protein
MLEGVTETNVSSIDSHRKGHSVRTARPVISVFRVFPFLHINVHPPMVLQFRSHSMSSLLLINTSGLSAQSEPMVLHIQLLAVS